MKLTKLFSRDKDADPIQQRLDRFTAESLHRGAAPPPVRLPRLQSS